MTLDPQTALARLRGDAENGPLPRLAALVVDDLLSRPAHEVVDVAWSAGAASQVLRATLTSAQAEQRTLEAVERGIAELAEERRTMGEVAPDELESGLREALARPWTPDRALVVQLIDRAPMRKLLRSLLLDALLGFARKLRQPVGPGKAFTKGFSGLSAFARKQTKKSPWGQLAGNLVETVSGEVERTLEKHAAEFADSALSGLMGQLADQLSDPARAQDQAALRLALLDGALSVTGTQLAAELERADPAATAKLTSQTLRGFVERDDLEETLRGWIEAAVELAGETDLATLLADVELLDDFRPLLTQVVLDRLQPMVASDAFGLWWAALFADD